MHKTQAVHTNSTHSDIYELDTPLRPKCWIIISTIQLYVAHDCYLSCTQMLIGALPVLPRLLSAPLWSLRLATVSDWPALLKSPPPSPLLSFSGKPI